jgi:transcriptional regulator with XRE-family HTH domain
VGNGSLPRRYRNAVGPQIARERLKRNLTQEALATKLQLAGLDLDRISVAKIETGIRSVYDYELAVIAMLLGVSANDLLPSHDALKPLLPALQRGFRK